MTASEWYNFPEILSTCTREQNQNKLSILSSLMMYPDVKSAKQKSELQIFVLEGHSNVGYRFFLRV